LAKPWDEILGFWFGNLAVSDYPTEERSRFWFGKREQTDETIRARFSTDLARAARGEYNDWKSDAHGRLALILLFDQFPRNIFRDTPQAFAFDHLAQALALEGIEQDCDQRLNPFQRAFFYLPLEHAENLDMQRKSVESHQRLLAGASPELASKLSGYLDYAIRHQQVIERFGRFPHRNKVLGRTSTAEEADYLKQPGSSF
jgi:uncharacterized protein (DUF924 family)